MPEQITVSEFLKESWDDYNSPTTSNFVDRMSHCRNTVSTLEETLDFDRSGLTKMKKSSKALHSSGVMHVSNESYMAKNLEKIGGHSLQSEPIADIGAAFLKFAVVTKELSALMKNLMQNLSNILMFPLDSFLKGDLRGQKGDLKKPFDKASKDYEAKFMKLEKEKKQLAKDAGMIRTEVTGAEIAEEMEKERRMFQLQMCEYLIKVNEIKTKKGVDLLQHLVEYYQAQSNYFQDGLKTIEHFRCYIEDLVVELAHIKQQQDNEKRQLLELRDALKTTLISYRESSSVPSGYNLHQLQGNKAHGYEKNGFLLKKSEGKMRKVWQRRKCWIRDGAMSITHSDLTKDPVKLNLLTCQVKLIHDDPGKKCFDLISSSKNRTYHFQAEDSQEMEAWISVLNNAKEAILLKAFKTGEPESSHINQSVKELTNSILKQVRRLPGNKQCCDCGAPDPEWVSVNLGVLICLECCGVHREMGVHISRTQSTAIDKLGSAKLLLARVVSNKGFNDIMEATLDTKLKPTSKSDMEDKKQFIRAKYERHRYAIVTCPNEEDRLQDLKQAVMSNDIFALLQVYAEGVDLMHPLPDTEHGESALHLAIQEPNTSLPVVDFIVQNSNIQHLLRTTTQGQTVLHMSARYNRTECMKLLLRVQPDLVNVEDDEKQTALEISQDHNHNVCVDLINHAIAEKWELFENVNIDWDLIQDDHLFDTVDYSDDDLDSLSTPDKKRARPGSLVMTSELSPRADLFNHRERSRTAESGQAFSVNLPPPPIPLKPKGLALPQNGANMIGSSSTLPKKKPAPLPPGTGPGHIRNHSDMSGFTETYSTPRNSHVRTPSDPPPLPSKLAGGGAGTLPKSGLPGAKLVLPPPPEFRNMEEQSRPVPQSRITRPASSNEEGRSSLSLQSSTASSLQSLSHSSEQLDSTNTYSGDSQHHRSDEHLDSDSGSIIEHPQPTPRPKHKVGGVIRCKAMYDCEADNEDELSFAEGEVIILIKEEEEEWWEGEIEGQPNRTGMFPAAYVSIM